MPRRVVLFLDYQNVYMGARESFHDPWDPSLHGQIDPIKLGHLLVEMSVGRDLRELAGVRIYRGRPESNRDPKGYGANLRQCTEWERGGANVITRTLRYPPGWPEEKPEEKGIDVALAMDFHAMAVRGEYDIGILMSTDTDLKPALEGVAQINENRRPRCEVAAWRSPSRPGRRLGITATRVWCHWLGPEEYKQVIDLTDYTVAR
jgi:NYN domain